MLADAGQVVHRFDAGRPQLLGVADAGHLEQLGRVERAAAQDHLAARDPFASAARATYSTPVTRVPSTTRRVTSARHAHVEVGAVGDRAEVGVRPRSTRRPRWRLRSKRGEALLAVAVDVVGERVAGLLHGVEERLEQRVGDRAPLEHERAVVAAVLVVGRGGEAVLHPLEVRQAVGVVPRRHAGVGRPPLVVERVAALEDHPVDARRPPEHLAPRVVHAPPAQVRLGLGLVLPVVEAVADREHQRRRHVDEDVEAVVRPPGLEHQHPGRGVGAEPVGEHAPRRPAAHDHDVVHAAILDAATRRAAAAPGPGCGPNRPPTVAATAASRTSTARPRATMTNGAAAPSTAPRPSA